MVGALALVLAARGTVGAAGGGAHLPSESPCLPQVQHLLSPACCDGQQGIVLLGESLTATLTARALCTDLWPVYRHIVLALDVAPSLRPGDRRRALDTAREAVSRLITKGGDTRLGMVSYDGRGLATCELDDDPLAMKRCVGRLDDPHGTAGEAAAKDLGIAEAASLLGRARRALNGYYELLEVIVVISDGGGADGATARHSARAAAADGRLVIAACVTHRCDRRLLQEVAPSYRYVYPGTALPSELIERLLWFGPDLRRLAIRSMSITGTLPDDVTYVPDSAEPPPAERSPDGRTFRWTFDWVPRDGVTLTLRLRPERSGDQRPSLDATGALLDNYGLARGWSFPAPPVMVLGRRP